MDRTLKSMLTRWAKDSKRTLSYLHSSDFTLYRDVAEIRTTDLEDAVSRLNSAYSAEGVSITNDDRPIVVRRSEEHTSELQSLMRLSYAVFCLKQQKTQTKSKK